LDIFNLWIFWEIVWKFFRFFRDLGGNFLDSFEKKFWEFVWRNFFVEFFWGIFLRNFLGGIFQVKFFGRIFLGGIFWKEFFKNNFLGGILWEEFFGRNSLFTLLKSAKLFEYGRNWFVCQDWVLSRFSLKAEGRKEEI
jgi:hypothetical protein